MIYITGKTKNIDTDLARLNFEAMQIKLAPGVTIHLFEIYPYLICRIWELCWCESIYMMLDYRESKWARIELFIAKLIGKGVYYERY